MTNRTPQRIAVGSRWRGFSNPHRVLCALLVSLQLLLPSLVAALPSDGNVVGGNAAIQQVNPKQLNIQQATDKAILNWKSFSIAADEAVHFVQPSISSIALNRVIGVDPSVILGQLQSNGRIFLLNPNGILFGAGAQINVGGLLATTLQIRDDDFMAGRYLFAQDPLKGLKSVVNQGTIHVSDHGFVVLAAPGVSNEGMIVANLGKVVLGSGQKLTVDLMGDGLINYAISGKILDQVKGPDGTPLSSAVNNSGTIQADGGHVILQAKAAGDIFASVVNQSGVVRARSLVNQEGVVRLDGGDSGLVQVAGTLDASGLSTGQKGGRVSVLGQSVELRDSSNINASGDVGGGRVLVGGNYQGLGPESNATTTHVAAGASITSDAITQGDGGNVIVWADGHTSYAGQVSAKGGQTGGNGGFVEVSGKNTLDFTGRVDTSAPAGRTGTLMLDPSDITISTGANANISAGPTFTGTAATSNLNIGTLQGALALNNVIVDTTSPFLSAGNITVSNAVTWASGNFLELRAHNNITVNAGISSTGLGVLRLIGNQDGIGGGNVALNAAISSRLGGIQLSGVGISSNAAGTITTTGTANQNAGNVTINATGAVNLAGTITTTGGTPSAGNLGRAGGTVTISGVGVTTGTVTANGSAGNGANQLGGNGGTIQVTSTNGVTTGNLAASGGNAGTGTANGGTGGTISVTNSGAGNVSLGTVTARAGNAIGTGSSAAGSVSATNSAAGAFLQTGVINTIGRNNGNGGSVTLSSAGALQFSAASTIQTTGGTALAGTAGTNGGVVNLSGLTVTTTGAITTSGGNGNGANQAGGHAGNITVTSNGTLNTSAGALTASGGNAGTGDAAGGNGGVISLTNNSAITGDITASALTARTGNAVGTGPGGVAGSVAVTQNNA
ncbi:MAG: filamentous hemagglutinin N-terminal domain-containing protein, partial [Nitrospiraceae bacterium]